MLTVKSSVCWHISCMFDGRFVCRLLYSACTWENKLKKIFLLLLLMLLVMSLCKQWALSITLATWLWSLAIGNVAQSKNQGVTKMNSTVGHRDMRETRDENIEVGKVRDWDQVALCPRAGRSCYVLWRHYGCGVKRGQRRVRVRWFTCTDARRSTRIVFTHFDDKVLSPSGDFTTKARDMDDEYPLHTPLCTYVCTDVKGQQ